LIRGRRGFDPLGRGLVEQLLDLAQILLRNLGHPARVKPNAGICRHFRRCGGFGGGILFRRRRVLGIRGIDLNIRL